MTRYHWMKPSDLPDRLELIDNVSGKPVATIFSIGREWQWTRSTSVLLHGAPSAEGNCRSLTTAKDQVLDGLSE